MNRSTTILLTIFCALSAATTFAQVVPPEKRGRVDAEREGFHDAANIRTEFSNFGMVGDYPPDPGRVDLSVFHSVEVPKGSGMNYSDGITPFVLAKIKQENGPESHIMETGFRERQGTSPIRNRVMRFEPRPGFFEPDPNRNKGRSPAISNDDRTWPNSWPDKENVPDDPGWRGSWNGYFGKRPAADQESFTVMDDDFYDAWDYFPDSRDRTRRGLGLRIEVRGFQWANPQAQNVIFWHYDITNEGTTDYNENIIFGIYMDSGVGGSALSCDGIFESDDDNAFYNKDLGLNLVYTWDNLGHGAALGNRCYPAGYLGYAYLETPGKPLDGVDNDDDGIIDEKRDGGPGELVIGQEAIRAKMLALRYDLIKFELANGKLESRPAYRAGRWWTGDEDLDWVAELHDTGADGVFGKDETDKDAGEGDGKPTPGEPYFDRTDLHESDQIGLTGFKMNRIRAPSPGLETDDIVFFDSGKNWPKRLYDQFSHPDAAMRFDPPLIQNYNIGFLFASGPFTLPAGKTERFSLALAYGADLDELETTVKTVQLIYNANYQFAVPPPLPTLAAEAGDEYVRLSWDDVAERGVDPVTLQNDFEGYRVYRATDPEFRDPKVITTGRGTGPIGNGRPMAQYDMVNGKKGFSSQKVEGVSYYLGNDSGLSHSFTDTTVTNGQLYYYAVTSYDHGADTLDFDFYPSENSITVSRTPRGGTILPINVIAARPEPKTLGYVSANASTAKQIAGNGSGSVDIRVINSARVPDNHTFNLKFRSLSPDSVRAAFYDLIDSTTGKVVFTNGDDLAGKAAGQVGAGLLPVVNTPAAVVIDPNRTGFTPASKTNVRFKTAYQKLQPINLRRVGYPNDLTITFADVPIDSSIDFGFNSAQPVKFKVTAPGENGDLRLKFGFRDTDGDGTLSNVNEFIVIITDIPGVSVLQQETWRVQLDTTGQSKRGPIVLPKQGDVYNLALNKPFGSSDVFSFKTTAQFINKEKARAEFKQEPYAVPNPYVGSASFEAERFAVSGRGERRMEFRGLPANSTIRIYTVRGELVQTLRHDGSNDGFVAWDLRTKDNLDIAPGLYIFHVDGGETGSHIGKFAIIK